MSDILDIPPDPIAEEMGALDERLSQRLPAKRLDDNLLVATWNLRAFGGLTEKWNASKADTPKRDLRALLAITRIVSRFDVLAIQEVKGDIKCLRRMMKALGPDWAFLLTDVTRGDPGNDERMAFVFDTRRVRPSGLACELVVPEEWRNKVSDDALTKQFARTPYAASFVSAGQTFILVTLHVLYGKTPKDRIPELKGIAEWMASWAEQEEEWSHNLIVLGDFNIDRTGDPAYDAFTSTGLMVPDALHDIPRTIFGDGGTARHYDQIAWFASDSKFSLTLGYNENAGSFDFVDHVFTEMSHQEVSWRISDHYPLWVEFDIRRH